MEYVSVIISSFWAIIEQFAVIFAPVIGIFLIVRLVKGILR